MTSEKVVGGGGGGGGGRREGEKMTIRETGLECIDWSNPLTI